MDETKRTIGFHRKTAFTDFLYYFESMMPGRQSTIGGARKGMGERSLAIIRDWSYEQCREGVLAAIQHVAGRKENG